MKAEMGDLNGSSCSKILFLLEQISQCCGCCREHRGCRDSGLYALVRDDVQFESIDWAVKALLCSVGDM